LTYDPHAPRAKPRRIGIFSSQPTFAKVDKRTHEYAYMAFVRRDLTEHIGEPSVTQKMLIERAAILSLRLAKLDAKILDDAPFTQHDTNYMIAWQNALTRVLVALGIHGQAARPPTALGTGGSTTSIADYYQRALAASQQAAE
jgi:hypothetical protein